MKTVNITTQEINYLHKIGEYSDVTAKTPKRVLLENYIKASNGRDWGKIRGNEVIREAEVILKGLPS